jgi:hypothetical protein
MMLRKCTLGKGLGYPKPYLTLFSGRNFANGKKREPLSALNGLYTALGLPVIGEQKPEKGKCSERQRARRTLRNL